MVVGLPLTGSQVQINATSAKLVGRKDTAARLCDVLLFELPKFRWTVEAAPAGQNATLPNTATLTPGVNRAARRSPR